MSYLILWNLRYNNQFVNKHLRVYKNRLVYQIYVDFRMTQWSATTIAVYNTLRTRLRWYLFDEINGKRLVHFLLHANETRQTIIILFKFLQHSIINIIIDKIQRRQWFMTDHWTALTWPVWVSTSLGSHEYLAACKSVGRHARCVNPTAAIFKPDMVKAIVKYNEKLR